MVFFRLFFYILLMKLKILNAVLIITSLLGYLEWGGDNSVFLFQSEYDVIIKLFTNPTAASHPFTLLPLLGQVLLLTTLFQEKPGKVLTYVGISCLGLLLGFMFIVGLLGLNFKIVISVLPFIMTAVYTLKQHQKQSSE